ALVVVGACFASDRACNKDVADEIAPPGPHDVDLRRSHEPAISNLDIQTAAARWVDDHGERLYRFALMRVRKPEVVQDLVQETLLACGHGYAKFSGRSCQRSWVVGIVKNKSVDYFRKHGRETSFTVIEFLYDEFSEKFVSIGFWNHDLGPHEWKPE